MSDPANSFRTAQLRPKALGGQGTRITWEAHRNLVRAAVDDVCSKRAGLLQNEPSLENLISGKLLLFWPEESLDCGAAAVSSEGYFDDGNSPPWDTWFWYGAVGEERPSVVSYVPEEFVSLVSAGVFVNPEACIKLIDIPQLHE